MSSERDRVSAAPERPIVVGADDRILGDQRSSPQGGLRHDDAVEGVAGPGLAHRRPGHVGEWKVAEAQTDVATQA